MPITYDENLKESKYTIIDIKGKTVAELRSNSVSEANMVYNMLDDRIHGEIAFIDYDNIISTTPILSDYKLQIYIQDKYNYQQFQTFNIVHTGMTLMDGKYNMVKFSLVDEYYFAFSRTNLVYSSKNCKIEDIVNKYTSLLSPTIVNKREFVYNTTKKYESLIVTGNHNFQQFLDYREIVDKINIYRTKNKIIFDDISDVEANCIDKSDEIIFRPEHPFSLNPLKIYDFDVSMLDRLNDVKDKPNRSDFFYNPLNKSIKNNILNYSYKDSVKKVSKRNGVIPNINDNIGISNYVRTMDNEKVEFSNIDILSNYIVELTVKGSVQLDIGQIVGLHLMVPGVNIENKILTGKWIVSRLSEKIIGMCYVQKLQLINASVEYKVFKKP